MKLVAILAASLLGVSVFAQTGAIETETTSAGLLGKRYADTGIGMVNYRHTSLDSFVTGLNVNVPVHTNIDVALNYSYSWFEGNEGIGHYAGTTVTGYVTRGDSKPYVAMGLGYWMNSQNWMGGDHGVWSAEAGIERSVNDKVSATFSVGYDDDFGQHRDGLWDVSVGGTYAFTSKLVGLAKISYLEYGHTAYSLGMAFRF